MNRPGIVFGFKNAITEINKLNHFQFDFLLYDFYHLGIIASFLNTDF